MRRYNITVPDDVAAEIEQVRDQVNLSAVCAKAMRAEAQRLIAKRDQAEEMRLKVERMALLIARLRSERAEWMASAGRG